MCGFTDVIQIVYTMSVTSLTHGVLIWLRLAPTRTGINPPDLHLLTALGTFLPVAT